MSQFHEERIGGQTLATTRTARITRNTSIQDRRTDGRKVCSRCDIEKDATSDFYARGGGASQPYCKQCVKDMGRASERGVPARPQYTLPRHSIAACPLCNGSGLSPCTPGSHRGDHRQMTPGHCRWCEGEGILLRVEEPTIQGAETVLVRQRALYLSETKELA